MAKKIQSLETLETCVLRLAQCVENERNSRSLAVALLMLPDLPELQVIRQRIAHILKNSHELLLDTSSPSRYFYIHAAISSVEPDFITGAGLARITKELLAAEISPGGPYFSAHALDGLDVNIAIVVFLQQQNVELAQLQDFIMQSAVHVRKSSERFQQEWLYFFTQLSCFDKETLLACLDWLESSSPNNRSILTYVRFLVDRNYKTDRSSVYSQRLENNVQDSSVIELAATTSLVARVRKQSCLVSPIYSSHASEWQNVHNEALGVVQICSEPVLGAMLTTLENIKSADTAQEIALFPYFFQQALRGSTLERGGWQWRQLGVANIFCWAAYTVYDDFLDNEGDTTYLPVANLAMRFSMQTYFKLTKNKKQKELILRQFRLMDQANAWELQYTRFNITKRGVAVNELPDYGDLVVLAERAAGHTAGVLLLADMSGFTASKIQLLEKALQEYLIARQLNDDIHDWSEDLQLGRCSYVVARLLAGANIAPGFYEHGSLRALLQSYFWESGFEGVSTEIMKHCMASRTAFKRLGIISKNVEFYRFLTKIENSVLNSQKKYASQKEFLQNFH